MCPTDVCHPYENVYPHLVCSWLLTPLSRRGRPAESQAPHGRTRGPDVSRRPRPLRQGSRSTRDLVKECLTASFTSVGVVFPRRRTDRASDTPVAPRSRPHASPAFAGAACPGRDGGFWPWCTGRRMRALRRDHP